MQGAPVRSLVGELRSRMPSVCVLSHFSRVRLFATPLDFGSSVPRILQAKILEWVAIPFSRGSSWPRDRTCMSYVSL